MSNGDFEAVSLTGWQVYDSTSAGSWYAFSAAAAGQSAWIGVR